MGRDSAMCSVSSVLATALLLGLVHSSSADYGQASGGFVVPFQYLSGSGLDAVEMCTNSDDWPIDAGAFNDADGLEGCKTLCTGAYPDAAGAEYVSGSHCCCQGLNSAHKAGSHCWYSESSAESYLYIDYMPGACTLPGSCSSDSGWDSDCLAGFTTQGVFSGDSDATGGDITYGYYTDAACTTLHEGEASSDTTLPLSLTAGTCSEVTLTTSGTATTSYIGGYCDTSGGSVYGFSTQAACEAWFAASYFPGGAAGQSWAFAGATSGACYDMTDEDDGVTTTASVKITCTGGSTSSAGRSSLAAGATAMLLMLAALLH